MATASADTTQARPDEPAAARRGGERVVVERISFPAERAHLAGNLFLPAERSGATALPGVTVTGTWTSVKEQMADRYAAKLAARGLAALSFDFTGFGMSGGEPREVESAALKARDIRHATGFLAGHPAVDENRVGAVAVCASAMYATRAAIDDERLRALVLIAPWIHDRALVREVYGGEDGVSERLRAADRARQRYDSEGVVEYVPVADASDPRAAMPMDIDFYTNPDRGKIPGWPNRFAVMAWREWLTLDAVALAPEVNVPTLIVHSEEAAIPDGARRFYEGLRCPKEIAWTSGTQFDFYDRPETVVRAVARAAEHLHSALVDSNARKEQAR